MSLPTTLVIHVEQSIQCVCLCVRTITLKWVNTVRRRGVDGAAAAFRDVGVQVAGAASGRRRVAQHRLPTSRARRRPRSGPVAGARRPRSWTVRQVRLRETLRPVDRDARSAAELLQTRPVRRRL